MKIEGESGDPYACLKWHTFLLLLEAYAYVRTCSLIRGNL